MDGRKNNKGTKGNKGNTKRYLSAQKTLQENIDKYSPVFWEKIGGLMEAGDKWALSEFNKILVKIIPQDITSGGEELKIIPLLQIDDIRRNNSDKKNKETVKED